MVTYGLEPTELVAKTLQDCEHRLGLTYALAFGQMDTCLLYTSDAADE